MSETGTARKDSLQYGTAHMCHNVRHLPRLGIADFVKVVRLWRVRQKSTWSGNDGNEVCVPDGARISDFDQCEAKVQHCRVIRSSALRMIPIKLPESSRERLENSLAASN